MSVFFLFEYCGLVVLSFMARSTMTWTMRRLYKRISLVPTAKKASMEEIRPSKLLIIFFNRKAGSEMPMTAGEGDGLWVDFDSVRFHWRASSALDFFSCV